MENLVEELRRVVEKSVRDSEVALDAPQVQARTPLATITRGCLIRQLWHGDRVLALLRDGQDHLYELRLMLSAGCAAAEGLALLAADHPCS
jgi:hypothetical protein